MTWPTHPLTHYILLTLGIALSLYLFVALERALRRFDVRYQNDQNSLEVAFQEIFRRLEAIEDQLADQAQRVPEPVQPVPIESGMNLNRRAHVLRMYRRGEEPAQIAAALSLPQTEVDLLLKLHTAIANHSYPGERITVPESVPTVNGSAALRSNGRL